MALPTAPVWKKSPFVRLIIPYIFGVIGQQLLPQSAVFLWILVFCSGFIFLGFSIAKAYLRFRLYWFNGVVLGFLLFLTGMICTYYQNTPELKNNFTEVENPNTVYLATLREPLSAKLNSTKTEATVSAIFVKGKSKKINLRIILYFAKGTDLTQIEYGSQILFTQKLQTIKSSGNPASFDFKKYNALQGIYYQANLKKTDFRLLKEGNGYAFWKILYQWQNKILEIFKKNIPGPQECGLAEALLIGYKNDLDKTMVNTYALTGVVHIIAISGLHLGLLYSLLMLFFSAFRKSTVLEWLTPLAVLSVLWLFSLLAGASPSVLRSAVMFSCIVVGKSVSRETPVYNNLAASAFLLLCYNPNWLWDTGFQLSYAAVLSIVIFNKHISGIFSFNNRLLHLFWKANAITLSAQVLTLPLILYYFHQFPYYFLLTNLLAIPLSSIILFGEILLCLIHFPVAEKITGLVIFQLIKWMNKFVAWTGQLPFASISSLSINVLQAVFMYSGIFAFWFWIKQKRFAYLSAGLFCLAVFACIRAVSFVRSFNRQQLIIYQTPHTAAIEFCHGRNILYYGNPALLQPETQAGILTAAHTLFRTSVRSVINNKNSPNLFLHAANKQIAIINHTPAEKDFSGKLTADAVIITGNPAFTVGSLAKMFACGEFIFDCSNSQKKIRGWKKECEQIGLKCRFVTDDGAVVMDLN